MAPGNGITVAGMRDENRACYSFAGSLTTPPCSEGVSWRVLKTPAHVSAAQLGRFGQVYAANARPVQPLNGRVVQLSK